MLFLLIGENRDDRKTKLGEIIQELPESEIVPLDDTTTTAEALEQYLYPSLFSIATPIVHAKFVLSSAETTLGSDFFKKLSASPTVFIFEELALPAPVVTAMKKSGALVHATGTVKAKKEGGDIFSIAGAIVGKDKKSRWMAYRAALATHPIEAILGILYWKVRTLAEKGVPGNEYEVLYRRLLDAHTRSWQTNAPLDALIEKVILTS
ncbi:MAG TPA: hypothetical protein VG982_02195 [Candidatus Paceibacterota bacterium]|jgi:hypothetical protein|nr:hypothetical protein [Candidatus Paceibacterota bacterium]